MFTPSKWHTRQFILCCNILFLAVGCGLSEMFSGSNAEKITEPCIELIPSATPTPTPTTIPIQTVVPIVTITPKPGKTPTPSESCGNAPGIVLICDGEPVEETPITVITPPPVQTPQAMKVIVNNTVPSCEYWPSCGIAPNPPCCLIQDGISVADDNNLTTVLVQAGSYNENITLAGSIPLTLIGGSGVQVVSTNTAPVFYILSAGHTITNMVIRGNTTAGANNPTILVWDGAGVTLNSNTIYAANSGSVFPISATALYLGNSAITTLLSNTFFDLLSTGGDALYCPAVATLASAGNNSLSGSVGRNTVCNSALSCSFPLCINPF